MSAEDKCCWTLRDHHRREIPATGMRCVGVRRLRGLCFLAKGGHVMIEGRLVISECTISRIIVLDVDASLSRESKRDSLKALLD
jgi:hypothetical protein